MMARFIKVLLISMTVLLGGSRIQAQIDTTFWFAAPWVTPDHDGNVQMAMRFSSFGTATTVNVKQPLLSFDTTFTMAPNSLFSLPLESIVNDLESKPADVVLSCGFKITSSENITVVYDFISDLITISPGTPNNPETYSLKGQNGMGTEFVVPFQTLWNNRTLTVDRNGDGIVTQPKQYFSVVATEPNTTIYITPRCNVVGHPANVTYSVFLPFAGSVYTCQNAVMNTSVPGNNLSGSIVVSDKPVSVTINDDSVNPSGGGGCFDLMGDQIVPVDVVGRDYAINRGFLNPGSNESIFIVATENFTTITMDDGVTTTVSINQGDTYQYSIDQQLTSVTADKPVYVVHMSGYGCELGLAIIPPFNCAGSDQVSFTRNNNQQFLLDILVPQGSENDFVLNGSTTLVPGSAFSPVPGTGGAWMGAQIDFTTAQIPSNTSNLITNSSAFFSLGVINGGPTTGCLYHYMSSFVRRVETRAANDTTLCNGDDQVALSGTVSGGSTTGIWTVLDGTGSFVNPTDLSTSYTATTSDFSQGELTFVLTSTGNCLPTADTMKVFYIQSPVVDAGPTVSYCENNVNSVPLNGIVQFASGGSWSGGNGGSFTNSGSPVTTYFPSPTDIAADSLILTLDSQGSFFACPSAQDSLIIYFTPAPNVAPGPDLVICSSISQVNLNGSVTGGASTGSWSSSGTGSFSPSQTNLSTTYNLSNADTSLNTLMLYLTSTNSFNNCLAVTDSIQITIIDKPIVDISSMDSICSTASSVDLLGSVSPGFSSSWTTTNGLGTIVDPNQQITSYSVSPVDTSSFTYLDFYLTSSGVCPPEQDSVRIYFVAPPQVNAGIDQAFCANQLTQFSGSVSGGQTNVQWSSQGSGTFTTSPNALTTFYYPSAADASNGFVDLILTAPSQFGCPADNDTVRLNLLEVPNANFLAQPACQHSAMSFQDATSYSGSLTSWSWNFNNNGTATVQNPAFNFAAAGNVPVTLIVEGDNGCVDTIIRNVVVHPAPTPLFLVPVICENADFQFTNTSFIPTGNIVAWNYDFGGGFSSTLQNPIFNFPTAGTYPVQLTVTSAFGCDSTATIPVVVNNNPNADFSMNPNPGLINQDIEFLDLSTADTTLVDWYWDFGDGEGANGQNTLHDYNSGGNFIVTLEITDANGCIDTAQRIMAISLLPVLPTGFSPNGDGENDEFIIRGGPFNATDFKIYNNWGELIFTSDSELKGWDGTYKGEKAPMGVYTWTFVVELIDGQIVRRSGDVTLIR